MPAECSVEVQDSPCGVLAVGRCKICEEAICESHRRMGACVSCFEDPQNGLICVDCGEARHEICAVCEEGKCMEHMAFDAHYEDPRYPNAVLTTYGKVCKSCRDAQRQQAKDDYERGNAELLSAVEEVLETRRPTARCEHSVEIVRDDRKIFRKFNADDHCPEKHPGCALQRVATTEYKRKRSAVYSGPAFLFWEWEWKEGGDRDESWTRSAEIYLFPDGRIKPAQGIYYASPVAPMLYDGKDKPSVPYRDLEASWLGPREEAREIARRVKENLLASSEPT